MSGSAVDSSEIEALPSVGAVMWVGYPGERGGEAIANAVFGKSDEFGKMSFSIYKQAYYDHLSPLDFNMRPNATTGSEGRTYRFCKASWSLPCVCSVADGCVLGRQRHEHAAPVWIRPPVQ